MVSSQDVENKVFLSAVRGYDKDEVHGFLRTIAADLRSLEEWELVDPRPSLPALRLSSDQIRTAQFTVALRGYDQDDVRQYLSEIADAFPDKDGTTRAAERLELDDAGAALSHVLRSATEEADAIRTAARRDADRILAAARREAAVILEEAKAGAGIGERDASRERRRRWRWPL